MRTLKDIAEELNLSVLSAEHSLEREVTGGYASDLLSCAMAKAQDGNVWVTLQSHPNVVAVAALLGLAGVIIGEGRTPEAATVAKADSEGVPLLVAPWTTFTIVARLAALGVTGLDQD